MPRCHVLPLLMTLACVRGRLAKLAKDHGIPLWEATIAADGSDAESSGRPVQPPLAVVLQELGMLFVRMHVPAPVAK